MNLLTQARLKELLHYSPDTGQFTWRIDRRYTKAGDIAGYVNHGYIRIGVDSHYYLAHRLAFLYVDGRFPLHEVDHINHSPADNRWCNIRCVTHAENNRNKSAHCNNTSGTIGVHWDRKNAKWHARIKVNGVSVFGGCFTDKQEAMYRRKQLEQEYHFHANHGM